METFILLKVSGRFPTWIDFVFEDLLFALAKLIGIDFLEFDFRPAISHRQVKLLYIENRGLPIWLALLLIK